MPDSSTAFLPCIRLGLLGAGSDALVPAVRQVLARTPLAADVQAHWARCVFSLPGGADAVPGWTLRLTSCGAAGKRPACLADCDAVVFCPDGSTGADPLKEPGNDATPAPAMADTLPVLLRNSGLAHSVLHGDSARQARQCLQLAQHLAGRLGWDWPHWQQASQPTPRRWQGLCEKCSVPECEHRLFSGLMGRNPGS